MLHLFYFETLVLLVFITNCDKPEKTKQNATDDITMVEDADDERFDPDNFESLYFLDVDEHKPIDLENLEQYNEILVCLKNSSGFCQEACISNYFFEIKRYALYHTNRNADGSCAMYLMGSGDEEAKNTELEYYEGEYTRRAKSIFGQCSILLESPVFNGFGEQKTIKRRYEQPALVDQLLWLEESGDVNRTINLSANSMPFGMTYLDETRSMDMTFHLKYGCEKRKDLTQDLIDNLDF